MTAATHCSACGRKIRPKRYQWWGPPTAWLEDYLNHARDCARYGLPADIRKET